MLIGYVRVSTAEQNSARQEVLMRELGVEKVYLDKASGKNANRPQLQEMLAFARQGDTIVVESISRFARNTRDLLELMEQLNANCDLSMDDLFGATSASTSTLNASSSTDKTKKGRKGQGAHGELGQGGLTKKSNSTSQLSVSGKLKRFPPNHPPL